MRTYKLTIAYDGTNYQGWQRQSDTDRTIQGILDNDFYIGTLRQGKYTRVKINGKEVKRNDGEHD